MTLTDDGMKSRDDALKDLKEVLRDRFRNCTTHPFGSYVTHLGDDDSDIDVYINLRNGESSLS